jgi:hypothetical protein
MKTKTLGMLFGFALLGACGGAVKGNACPPTDGPQTPAGQGAPENDGGPSNGAGSDSGAGPVSPPSQGDAGAPAAASDTTYNAIADVTQWSTFDTSAIGAGGGDIGAAFDGRFVYLVPLGGGVVPRYDTRGPFDAASSWSTFDVGALGLGVGFRGAVFDGQYVYFVPNSGPQGLGGVVVRYDTHADFASSSAWASFDVATVDPRATGFWGGTFDGRFLYLTPYGQDSAPQGMMARLDTWASFTAAASWSVFDTSVLGDRAKGYIGATFDGRYVYLAPYGYAYGQYGSMATRYDTQGTFTDPKSWSTFDTTTANPSAVGFFAANFDGRFAYLVPYNGDGSWGHQLARYDTTAGFGDPASWSTFDTSQLGIGPMGTAFDGRYLWLVPNATPADGSSGGSGLVARLDTQADLHAAGAWSTFDTSTLDPSAKNYIGGAFDGEYVYLVPCGHPVAVRFRAKTPPSMPSAYHGSFY